MTLAKGLLLVICKHFQRTFSLKLLNQVQLNFIAFRQRGQEVYIFDLCHMIKMAFMPIYGKKNFKNLLSMDGQVTCNFMSFSTVFQSYQENRPVIMKGCVKWNSIYD